MERQRAAEVERLKAELEAEKRRADEAEFRMEMAQKRAMAAEEVLSKGRRVSAVLRSVAMRLNAVVQALERSYFSPRNIEEKRALGRQHEQMVDVFGQSVPEDGASQAAWLAVKGWLRYLSGFEKDAFELFRKSREVDPDVSYGFLFESMVWLSKYVPLQPLPRPELDAGSLRSAPWPPETEAMRAARERITSLLEGARSCSVWGESATGEFQCVLDGLRAVHAEDLELTEKGLSKALSIPELMWFRNLLLQARALARFRKKDFPAAIMDLEELACDWPENVGVHAWLGMTHFAWGAEVSRKGNDPQPYYRKALESLTAAVRIEPHLVNAWFCMGLIYENFERYEKALEALNLAGRMAGRGGMWLHPHIDRVKKKAEEGK
jgi:hypothetical protein